MDCLVRSPLIKDPVTGGFPVLSLQVSPHYPQRGIELPVSSYPKITNGHFLKFGRIVFVFFTDNLLMRIVNLLGESP